MSTGKTVLVIEDEIAMLMALVETLENNGFRAHKAKDGNEGLAIAKRERPDLILLDILMPQMDGMTMMKHLREDAWGKKVPVIILTNVNPDSNEILNAVTAYEPAYYMVKSNVRLEGVVDKVKEVLKIDQPVQS